LCPGADRGKKKGGKKQPQAFYGRLHKQFGDLAECEEVG
jgi:hypothetical protein